MAFSQHSFTAGAPASVPPLRSAASILKGKAAELARNAQRLSQPQGVKPSQQTALLSPNARFRQGRSLPGKALSKLPDWQRQLSEKKAKVRLLCLPFQAMMRYFAKALQDLLSSASLSFTAECQSQKCSPPRSNISILRSSPS